MASVVLVALCTVPPVGPWLEATMARHMLLEYPLLVASGAMAAQALPRRVWRRLRRLNPGGVPGLLLALAWMAAAMVPRVVDAAVADAGANAIKVLFLLGAGAAAALSWRAAGRAGQAFAIGNAAWMTATAGVLLRETPTRVCAQYLEGDQWRTGWGLVAVAVLGSAVWLAREFRPRRATPR